MDMIGIVYSAMSTVEMPTLERCSNLTIYPECIQPHWQPASSKNASGKIFVICMPAPQLSRRAGQASPRPVSPRRRTLCRRAACRTRTSGRRSQKPRCSRTSLSSRPSGSHLSQSRFALPPSSLTLLA